MIIQNNSSNSCRNFYNLVRGAGAIFNLFGLESLGPRRDGHWQIPKIASNQLINKITYSSVYKGFYPGYVKTKLMAVPLFLLLGSQHQLGTDVLLKVLLAKSLEFHGTFLESDALLVSVLGHLGGHVVTDDRVQAGNKHQTKANPSAFSGDRS